MKLTSNTVKFLPQSEEGNLRIRYAGDRLIDQRFPKLTDTNMTNSIVSAENGSTAGRTLTVTYDGGSKSLHITVPPNAPIVRYVLADRSAAFIGSTVFIKTNPGDQARLVTIGKGVTPPM